MLLLVPYLQSKVPYLQPGFLIYNQVVNKRPNKIPYLQPGSLFSKDRPQITTKRV